MKRISILEELWISLISVTFWINNSTSTSTPLIEGTRFLSYLWRMSVKILVACFSAWPSMHFSPSSVYRIGESLSNFLCSSSRPSVSTIHLPAARLNPALHSQDCVPFSHFLILPVCFTAFVLPSNKMIGDHSRELKHYAWISSVWKCKEAFFLERISRLAASFVHLTELYELCKLLQILWNPPPYRTHADVMNIWIFNVGFKSRRGNYVNPSLWLNGV